MAVAALADIADEPGFARPALGDGLGFRHAHLTPLAHITAIATPVTILSKPATILRSGTQGRCGNQGGENEGGYASHGTLCGALAVNSG